LSLGWNTTSTMPLMIEPYSISGVKMETQCALLSVTITRPLLSVVTPHGRSAQTWNDFDWIPEILEIWSNVQW